HGLPDGRVLDGRKQVENAVDGGAGAGGVNGAEHQVARLGRVDGRLEGFHVTQLAYQNDVRVLTDGILEGLVPVDAIQADFAVIDHRLLGGEGEFDRVFDGQDVQGFPLVDVVKHGGNGGALAAAGDTGQDDQPFRKITQLFNTGRQAQLFEAWNNIVDAPGHQ